jgi:pyruvate formate lyase activating enzyme
MIDEVERKSLSLSRRNFLGTTALCVLSWAFRGTPPAMAWAQKGKKGLLGSKLSTHFTSLGGGKIRCGLCPRECIVPAGRRGFCGVRENREGRYYSLVYGNPCAVHLDPVEKKPFYHLLPASTSFSIATAGCNFRCKFCQNWEISQAVPDETYNLEFPPEEVVKQAKRAGSRSIAYTYVEPTIFYEYMMDTARLAQKEGILNVYHSNGFINPAPLKDLCKVLAGANIDLKGFTEDFYGHMSMGRLAPVLRTLKILKSTGVHLEVTNLVIPTQNDNPETVRKMCAWIKGELGADTPVHFSRFYPLYKLRNLPPTPVTTLERNRKIAMDAGLNYAYIGNVPGHEGERTFCPGCKKVVVSRRGYSVLEINLKQGKCKFCGRPIPGLWA